MKQLMPANLKRVVVYLQPISMRWGPTKLRALCRDEIGIEPDSATSSNRLVPWLAAEGPLAYTPELPPERDSFFQYGWVLPQVCRPGLRRHAYFGAMRREAAHDVFEDARRGAVDRFAHHEGTLVGPRIEAPIAVYRHNGRRGDGTYVFIQHGSYQCVPRGEQPELEAGYVHLHRGIPAKRGCAAGASPTRVAVRRRKTQSVPARFPY